MEIKKIVTKFKELYGKHKEIINYLIVGVLTTIISLIVYYVSVFTILNPDNAFELQIANILKWISGVTFAYFTNRKFVFESKETNRIKEACKFVSSRITTLVLTSFLMFLFVTVLKGNDKIMVIITQFIEIVGNYILSKLFVFKKNKEQEDN